MGMRLRRPRAGSGITSSTLFQNIAALGILQVLNYFLPLITIPYTSRVLGPDYFGVLGISNSLVVWLLLVTDFGFQLSATPEIAHCRDDKSLLEVKFNSIMYAKLLLLFVAAIVLGVFVLFVYRQYYLVFLLSFGVVVGQTIFPVWFFQGMEEMRFITIVNAGMRIFFVLLVFPCVRQKSDIIMIPILNSVGAILGGIASLIIVRKKFGISMLAPAFGGIKEQIKKSATFFLSRLSVSVYTSSTAMFLGFVAPFSFVGCYSAAEKLYSAIQMMYSPLVTAIYPHMVRNRDFTKFKRILRIVVLVFYPCLALVFILAPVFVRVLFGDGYGSAVALVRWFCLVAGVVLISQLIGYPLLGAYRREVLANTSVILGSVFHLVELVFLIARIIPFQYVVILIFCTETFILLLRLYYLRSIKKATGCPTKLCV